MPNESQLSPISIIVFGATGDLVWRKLVPALYNLAQDERSWLRPALVVKDPKNA